MHIYMLIYITLLFFILSPGVLITIPNIDSKVIPALVHSIVFTIVYYYTYKLVWEYIYSNNQQPVY